MPFISLVFALLAIINLGHSPSQWYFDGFAKAHDPHKTNFIGLVWRCDDETCFAGLNIKTGELVTGP